ncbi:hypothetical protein HPULCUR_010197 [Helicostylum pulchrum]|uniref:Uncharacterized protein n=1 Tax=Helicostylum pulchrum TaxID=562976 RepID=A0ABP9YCL1_9FUNG
MITGASSLLWFFVLITMCLYSPWVYPIYIASVRAVSPLIHTLQQVTLDGEDDGEDELESEYIHGYCFEIYHHQRWWIPTGWGNLLLPQDLPLWSDVYLEKTPSIKRFQLPPTTYLNKLNSKNQQKVISWTWLDPNWTIRKDGTDKEGWQYGNWNWKSWSSQSGGIINCTRRQKWTRYAQRKEYWVEVESCCSSLIGGSATDSDSVYNWDQSGTSRSSSIF